LKSLVGSSQNTDASGLLNGNILLPNLGAGTPAGIRTAIVFVNGTGIFEGKAKFTSNAKVSATYVRIRTGEGSITADATVTSDMIRIRTDSADIECIAEVEAAGGVVYEGHAEVNAYADVACVPYAIKVGQGYITCNGTVVASGKILGEGWIDTSYDTNTWSAISPGAETWTEVTAGPNTWVETSFDSNTWNNSYPYLSA